jgi:hypothetical protein
MFLSIGSPDADDADEDDEEDDASDDDGRPLPSDDVLEGCSLLLIVPPDPLSPSS